MEIEEFYKECGKLLGVDHQGQPFPYYKRTRWNNRTPGQGRFPGRGIVRVFGSQVHIALTNPPIHHICQSKEDCLVFLKGLDLT